MAVTEVREGGRSVAVMGSARNTGTTLTAIALARTLAQTSRVVLVDLAFSSPNIDVISNDPNAGETPLLTTHRVTSIFVLSG